MKYATARICLKAHVISEDIDITECAEKFCTRCGLETFTKCPSCSSPIHGTGYGSGRIYSRKYRPPKYCYECGQPYPWITNIINKTDTLISKNNKMSTSEKERFITLFKELLAEGQCVSYCIEEFRELLSKCPQSMREAFRETTIGVISQSIVSALFR